MSHSHHHHGHAGDLGDWEEPVGVGVRHVLTGAVVVLGLATLVGLVLWWPRGEAEVDRSVVDFGNRVAATVTSAETGPCSFDPADECRVVEFRITEGDAEGETGSLEQAADSNTPAGTLDEGDDFLVSDSGADAGGGRFQFADLQRSSGLLILALVFGLAVVALGRLRGLLALGGIVISIGVLLVYVFPALLQGTTPLGVALTGAGVIAFGTLYLAHGVNQRTTVALLGTLASLLLTATLASLFAGVTHLSGLASEESLNLLAFAPELDFRGLLLAAVVIGALGVLDDVTITQVSAVWELRRSDPGISARQLYAAGIRIGRDHIASTVNTLVLAYSAAALPLLLLYTQSGLGLGDVLTGETVAVEVVQTLVGSIGLVASVPLTTALACWVVTRAQHDGGAGAGTQPDERPPGRRRPERGPQTDPAPHGPPQDMWPHAEPAGWPQTPAEPATRGGRSQHDETDWPHHPATSPRRDQWPQRDPMDWAQAPADPPRQDRWSPRDPTEWPQAPADPPRQDRWSPRDPTGWPHTPTAPPRQAQWPEGERDPTGWPHDTAPDPPVGAWPHDAAGQRAPGTRPERSEDGAPPPPERPLERWRQQRRAAEARGAPRSERWPEAEPEQQEAEPWAERPRPGARQRPPLPPRRRPAGPPP